MIQSKSKGLIPFIEKPAQRKVNDIIIDHFNKNKPCKMIVLKARQVGMSTDGSAITYALTSQMPDKKAYIVADIEAHSNNIFNMQKLMHEYMEKSDNAHLAPALKKSNARELEFDQIRSKISIASAENKKAARSGTYHFVQLTEAGYFPDLAEFMKGLQMPKEGFVLLMIETTANNFGDEFHKLCQAAMDCLIDFVFVFIAWFDEETYRMPLVGGKMYSIEGIEFDSDNGPADFLKEELELKAMYGLDDEQLNWRRYTIINDCNRKVKDFRQEFPSTPEEAFQFAGGCRFDVHKLKRQLGKAKRPKAKGNLVEVDGKVKFVEDEDGVHSIYRFPEPGMKCVVGGDAAEGKGEEGDPDYSAMCTLDRCYGEVYSTCRTRSMSDDEFKIEAKKLGLFYNNAIVGFESYPSAHGYAIMKWLGSHYGNCHYHTVEDEATKKTTKKFGWRNTTQSREEIISIFDEDLSEGLKLNDKVLVNEGFTFIKHTDAQGIYTGRSEHARGAHDDLLFARMIAGKLRRLYPYTYPVIRNQEYKASVKGHCKARMKKKKRLTLSNI